MAVLKDKEATLQDFFSSFTWNAYDENTVPDDATMPWITYGLVTDSLDHPVSMAISLWDKGYSWASVTQKAQEISHALTFMNPPALPCQGGRIYIKPGTPFTQRMADSSDSMIRRIYINLEIEYFTET